MSDSIQPPKDDHTAFAEFCRTADRWKKWLYPDLPGEPLTGQEFNDLTITLIVLIGRYASHTNAAPLEELRRLFLQRRYATADPSLPEPSWAKLLETAQAAVCRVDEVAAWLRTCPVEGEHVEATTPRAPSSPVQYLLSWREILDALDMNCTFRNFPRTDQRKTRGNRIPHLIMAVFRGSGRAASKPKP
jgi:hypothetical protein